MGKSFSSILKIPFAFAPKRKVTKPFNFEAEPQLSKTNEKTISDSHIGRPDALECCAFTRPGRGGPSRCAGSSCGTDRLRAPGCNRSVLPKYRSVSSV